MSDLTWAMQQEIAKSVKANWKPGDRIQLTRLTDPFSRLEVGEKGTISSIDSLGTVHVLWDRDGATLGLIPGEDGWKRIENDN